jgi:hypothetical protein
MDVKWRNTALKEALVAGVITVVICLIINFFLSAPETGAQLGSSLVIPVTITSLIIGIINTFLKRATAKKHIAQELPSNKAQASYAFVPDHPLAFIFVYTIAGMFFIGFAFAGLFAGFLPTVEFSQIAVMTITSVITGVAAFYVSYHCSVFLVSYYQRKFAKVV